MKKITKAEATHEMALLQEKIEKLKVYIEQDDKADALVCETFTTRSGKTGVIVQFPRDVHLEIPVTEYMVREFIDMGGEVWDAESRIKKWAEMRFPMDEPMHEAWRGDVRETYRYLPQQPTVRQLAGTTHAFLVDIAQDTEGHAGKSFNDLMEEKVDVVNPIGWLGLLIATANPKDTHTYLSREGWEWVGAVNDSYVAGAYSSSDGLGLYWDGPGASWVDLRVRSSVS